MPHVWIGRLVAVLAVACAALVVGGAAFAQRAGDREVPPQRLFVQRAWSAAIGIQVRDPGASEGEGAYVTSVSEAGPAAKAGIRQGDVIVEFDGERVRSAAQLTRLVRETSANRTVRVVVQRDGKRQELTLTVGESRTFSFQIPDLPQLDGRQFSIEPPILRWPWPDDRQLSPLPQQPFNPRLAPPLWFYSGAARLGVTVQDLTEQLAEYFGAQQGVLVSGVIPGGPAAKAGLRAGDVITAVDKQPVRDTGELRHLLAGKRAGDQVTVTIVRDRKTQSFKIVLEDEKRSV
jgi:serine protease Do